MNVVIAFAYDPEAKQLQAHFDAEAGVTPDAAAPALEELLELLPDAIRKLREAQAVRNGGRVLVPVVVAKPAAPEIPLGPPLPVFGGRLH